MPVGQKRPNSGIFTIIAIALFSILFVGGLYYYAHRNAAAWKGEDDNFAPIRIMLQLGRQHLAGLGSIVKGIFHGVYRG